MWNSSFESFDGGPPDYMHREVYCDYLYGL